MSRAHCAVKLATAGHYLATLREFPSWLPAISVARRDKSLPDAR